MKESARLEQILERYKLTAPLSFFTKRKTFKFKRKTLARILKLERYDSMFVSAAVYFEYLLGRFGIRTTPAGGAKAFATAAVFSLFVILSSSLALVYNYSGIMQTFTAKIEIQDYQRGNILFADSGVKIIRENKMIPALMAKDRLITKDEIITGESGTIVFQMEKRTLVRMMPKSAGTVEIDLKTKAINLRHGTVLCNVRELAIDEKFSVTTSNAMIVVSGTQFSITYENERTAVTVIKGAVQAINLNNNEAIQIGEGKTAVISGYEIKQKDSEKTEKMILQRFGRLKYTDNIMDKNDMEMDELRETIMELGKDTEEDKEDKKIKKVKEEKKILTLEDIKEKYGKLEEIQLYNGKKYTGAIISRGGIFTFITVNGIKKASAKDVKNVRIIK